MKEDAKPTNDKQVCNNPCKICDRKGVLENGETCSVCGGTGCTDQKSCSPAGGLGCKI